MSEGAPARLREERERLGKSQRGFAELVGVSKNTQLAYEGGGSPITLDYLSRSADHGVDVVYVATGTRASEPVYAKAEDVRRVLRGEAPIAQGGSADLDLVPVAEIDLAYGMGGTYADIGVETQVLHFPRAWLESITRTPPSELTFARGKGDSMQPTLQDGDIVLIDRSIRSIREQDAIWALTIGDIAMIKRVRVKGERVSILSDNDRIPADDVHHEEINVVGRVVFIGRRI